MAEQEERLRWHRFCWSYVDYTDKPNEFKLCDVCWDYEKKIVVHNNNSNELVTPCDDPICKNLLYGEISYPGSDIHNICIVCFRKFFKILYKFPEPEPYEMTKCHRLCVIRFEEIKLS